MKQSYINMFWWKEILGPTGSVYIRKLTDHHQLQTVSKDNEITIKIDWEYLPSQYRLHMFRI